MASKGKKVAIGCFGVLVLVCAGVPTLLWTLGGGSPNVAVDYEAKLNERAAAVPEADRAWPIYRDLVIALAARSSDELAELADPAWRTAEPSEFEERIESLSDELAQIRLAASKPGLGFVTSEKQPDAFWEAAGQEPPLDRDAASAPPVLLDMFFLPHLGQFRSFAKLLEADASLAARQGDGARYVSDIDAILSIADQSEEHRTLINQLVAVAIRVMAFDRINETLISQPDLLDEALLARVQARLSGLHGGGDYRLDMSGEQCFFYDFLQRIYTDDGNGNGRFTANGLAMLSDLDGYGASSGGSGSGDPSPGARIMNEAVRLYASDRRTVTAAYENVLDGASRWSDEPLWDRRASDEAAMETIDAASRSFPPDPGMMMVSLIVPAYSRAFTTAENLNQQRDATAASLEVARYRAKYGEWPGSLDDLVPEFLDAVPVDRFSGDPLRYRVLARGPVLYSVGMDRDDDGGRSAERAMSWVPSDLVESRVAEDPAAFDGDWVFFGKEAQPGADGDTAD